MRRVPLATIQAAAWIVGVESPSDVEEKMKISSDSVPSSKKRNGSGRSEANSSGQGTERTRPEEMIAVAAYFRAEQRGFAPGDELGDWFQAEAEYKTGATSNSD